MKSKAVIPLAIGLVVGVVAIKYTLETVKQAKGSVKPVNIVKALVAKQDIPITVPITQEMFTSIETPQTPLLPADCIRNGDDLIGRVTKKSIAAGSPILPSMLAPLGTPPGLNALLKPGYRGISVKIDESSSVGYLLKPGDWVDVLAISQERGEGREKKYASKIILQQIQVGAVGQQLGTREADDESGGAGPAKTVTLLVKTDQATTLHEAQARGKISLTLRGPDDNRMTNAEGKMNASIFGTVFAAWAQGLSQQPEPQVATLRDEPQPTPAARTSTVWVINQKPDGSDSNIEEITYSNGSRMGGDTQRKGKNSSFRSNTVSGNAKPVSKYEFDNNEDDATEVTEE